MARPKGRKNNATLIKEAELGRCLKLCEGTALIEAPKIVEAMAKKAKEGDVAAAKLILDRVYPTRSPGEGQRTTGITINITPTGVTQHGQTIDQDVSEADALPPERADGEECLRQEGSEVLTFDAGKARN